jgi:hypothetical protein
MRGAFPVLGNTERKLEHEGAARSRAQSPTDPFARTRCESVGVIRAFSRGCEAANMPAAASRAKIFSCGKFDFARLRARTRESLRDLRRTGARNVIAFKDMAETPIPRALLRCCFLLDKICAGTKVIGETSACGLLYRRGRSARTDVYTQN